MIVPPFPKGRGFERILPQARPQYGDSPVGSVIAFAGNLGTPMPDSASPPDSSQSTGSNVTSAIEAWGWMLCDGRTLNSHQYPELFAVLGYQYGGSGDSFNIPDYRGYFLRGVDDGSGNDPDVSVRTVPPGGTGTQAEGGSIQNYAILDHTHDYQSAPAPTTTGDGGNASSKGTQLIATSGPLNASGDAITPASLISQNETRPKNIYVNYLVKFTYGFRLNDQLPSRHQPR